MGKFNLLTIILLSLTVGYAEASTCRDSIKQAAQDIQNQIKNSVAPIDQEVYDSCFVWMNNTPQYDGNCPAESQDWQNIKAKLWANRSKISDICANKDVCEQGCGNAKGVLMFGGSFQEAIATIP